MERIQNPSDPVAPKSISRADRLQTQLCKATESTIGSPRTDFTFQSVMVPVTRQKLEQLWQDPGNWKAGWLYSCQEDPRVIVPKRQKWRGWTVNFAHRSAIPILVFMIVAAALPVSLLAIFGLAGTPIWWISLILTMALLCLACWYFSSPHRFVKR